SIRSAHSTSVSGKVISITSPVFRSYLLEEEITDKSWPVPIISSFSSNSTGNFSSTLNMIVLIFRFNNSFSDLSHHRFLYYFAFASAFQTRNELRHLLFVVEVLLPKSSDQILFFIMHSNQNVDGEAQRQDEVPQRHVR